MISLIHKALHRLCIFLSVGIIWFLVFMEQGHFDIWSDATPRAVQQTLLVYTVFLILPLLLCFLLMWLLDRVFVWLWRPMGWLCRSGLLCSAPVLLAVQYWVVIGTILVSSFMLLPDHIDGYGECYSRCEKTCTSKQSRESLENVLERFRGRKRRGGN